MSRTLKKSSVLILVLMLCVMVMGAFATEKADAATKTHLKKTSIVLTRGTTYQQKLLTASNKTIKATLVTWSSNNRNVAKVSKSGKVTAISQGTTTIKAKYKGTTYSFKVKVKDAYFKYSRYNVAGKGITKTLSLYNAYNKKINAKDITWESANENIATVSYTGKVKGVGYGLTKITAKYKGQTYTCEVYVCEGISTRQDSLKIHNVGGSQSAFINAMNDCGDAMYAHIIEGEDVVAIEFVSYYNPENTNWYQRELKVTGLKEGTAVIEVLMESEENYEEVAENKVYITVTVGNGNSSSGTNSNSTNDEFINQVITQSIEMLKNSLRDPNSLQVYNTSVT